jgi:uncharacterized membrane protein YhaH (DUF805 family)
MSFGQAIKSFWAKYATFTGRARRSEYWYAWLFVALVSAGVATLFPATDDMASPQSNLWSLATLVVVIANRWLDHPFGLCSRRQQAWR